MKPAEKRLALAALAVAVGMVILWYQVAKAPAPRRGEVSERAERVSEPAPAEDAATPSPGPGPASPPVIPEPENQPIAQIGEEPTEPSGSQTVRQRVFHVMDPCGPAPEPDLPAGYDEVSGRGVTVLSPPGLLGPVESAALLSDIHTILAEVAILTGTVPRASLTVVVYRSKDDFADATGAPPWAGGAYDGAVRLPLRRSSGEVAMRARTLRHELVHAQLHAAVGCTPLWFNEGLADYFEATVGSAEYDWLEMLRQGTWLALATFGGGLTEVLDPEEARFVYSQSLLMVMYTIDRGGQSAIGRAVGSLRSGLDPNRLWDDLHPGVTPRDVFRFLAVRLFDMEPGPVLGEILAGTICCHSYQNLADFRCGTGPPRPRGEARVWIDRTTRPISLCFDN